jgi:hypothetical protein
MNNLKLTLSCPVSLSEQVVEHLFDSDVIVSGFTSFPAYGHGRDFSNASLREQVRGRVNTTIIVIVLPSDAVGAVLAELRARFPTPHLAYWTEPVQSFGDFG